jgi:hypothetical protein
MSFARVADVAKTRIETAKITFPIRMVRIMLAERGQTAVWRSELLRRVQSWDPPSIGSLIGPLACIRAFLDVENIEFALARESAEMAG